MTENKIDVIERNENPINELIWLGVLLSDPKLSRIYHSINIGGENATDSTSKEQLIQETGLSKGSIESALERLIELDAIRSYHNENYKTEHIFLEISNAEMTRNSDYIIQSTTIGFFGKQYDNTELREIFKKYGSDYIHEISHIYTTVKQEKENYSDYVSSVSKLSKQEASVIDSMMGETVKELDQNTLYDLAAGGLDPNQI